MKEQDFQMVVIIAFTEILSRLRTPKDNPVLIELEALWRDLKETEVKNDQSQQR